MSSGKVGRAPRRLVDTWQWRFYYFPNMKKKAKSKPSAGNGARGGENMQSSGAASEDRVVLKPFLGMKPGAYLTVLYGAVLALIVFFVLFFPGIRAYGSQVSFQSDPAGASVLVDGVRVGATPVAVFVKAGPHDIIIRKPDFSDFSEKRSIPGKVFGSLIVPGHLTVSARLSLKEAVALENSAAFRFASWSLIGEAHSQYQFPPVLSNAVRDLYAGKQTAGSRSPGKADALLAVSLLQVQSPSLLRDYLNAESLDISAGGAAGPLQLVRLFEKIIHLKKNTQGFPLWLSVVLPSDPAAQYTHSDWYKGFMSRYTASLTLPPGASGNGALPGPGGIALDGISFVGIRGGTFIMGREEAGQTSTDPLLVPAKVSVKSFYIMPTETDRAMFARFLAANPSWRPAARSTLVKEGLVTGSYLADWGSAGSVPAGTGDLPVTDVSYAAATAFAKWLSARLPGYLSGYEVRLPTEAEWEYAARLNDTTSQEGVFQDTYPAAGRSAEPIGTGAAGRLGLRDLMGNVWEWTDNWYRPAEPALTAAGAQGDAPAGTALGVSAAANMPAAHRTVKGGSFANRSDALSPATRGSLPPDWCTPYLGFRLVIAPRS